MQAKDVLTGKSRRGSFEGMTVGVWLKAQDMETDVQYVTFSANDNNNRVK